MDINGMPFEKGLAAPEERDKSIQKPEESNKSETEMSKIQKEDNNHLESSILAKFRKKKQVFMDRFNAPDYLTEFILDVEKKKDSCPDIIARMKEASGHSDKRKPHSIIPSGGECGYPGYSAQNLMRSDIILSNKMPVGLKSLKACLERNRSDSGDNAPKKDAIDSVAMENAGSKADEDDIYNFASVEEMLDRRMKNKANEYSDRSAEEIPKSSIMPEISDGDSDDDFLSPEMMIARKYGDRLEASTKKHENAEIRGDHILESIMESLDEPEETNRPRTDELLKMRADIDLARETEESRLLEPEQLSIVDSADNLVGMPMKEEIESVSRMTRESILSTGKMTPGDVDGTDELEEETLNQLDTGPILKKKDIYSPVDMLDPGELTTEEKFVSSALAKGTLIRDRYVINKILSEKRDRNTYRVADSVTQKKLILKEFLPPDTSREDYLVRRDAFRDNVRIISAFKHLSLAEVYEAFTENYRDYYLMEVVEGLSITRLSDMNTRSFSEKEALKWGRQLCDVTEFLHYRPTPFTLGEIGPGHIMVDNHSNVRITGYDLQRFFDINRTLEFMPDDPKKLYGDITKVARILFFLLTKKEFDDNSLDIEWPEGVSLKMQKLLETTCRTGQKTYGDIKVFREKLEDTQVEDSKESLARRFIFPKLNLDFSWIFNFARAVISQRPAMIALEVAFIIFLAIFSFAQHKTKKDVNEFQSPGGPIAWLSAVDELNLYNANDFNRLFRKRLGRKVSVMIPATAMIKPRPEDKAVETNIILIGYQGLPLLEMLDRGNLRSLGFIRSELSPSKMVYDEENRLVYVLHKDRGCISMVDLNRLETADVFLVGNEPVDMSLIALDKKEVEERNQLIKLQDEDPLKFREMKKQIPTPTIVVSNTGSKDLMFLNGENGRLKGSVAVDGSPAQIAVCRPTRKVFLLDRDSSRLMVVDMTRMKSDRVINIPGQGPSAMVLDPIDYKLWISMNKSDSLAVVDPQKGVSREIKGFGNNPRQIIFDRDSYKVWVLNQGTKDVAIIDAASEKLLKKIDIGKSPDAMCIDGHRYFGYPRREIGNAFDDEDFRELLNLLRIPAVGIAD